MVLVLQECCLLMTMVKVMGIMASTVATTHCPLMEPYGPMNDSVGDDIIYRLAYTTLYYNILTNISMRCVKIKK